MSDVLLRIIAAECKRACSGEADLEQRTRKAMAEVAAGHWMAAGDDSEDVRFRGAIAGVMLADETTDDDKARLVRTINLLRSLQAATQGVPVDFEALIDETGPQALPLSKWWNEEKARKRA
jgi:hypothetical protein